MADAPKRRSWTTILVAVAVIAIIGWLLLNFGGARPS